MPGEPEYIDDENIDYDKLQKYTLAALFFTSFRESEKYPWRSWKSHYWDVMVFFIKMDILEILDQKLRA
jgi:hypothetical protein